MSSTDQLPRLALADRPRFTRSAEPIPARDPESKAWVDDLSADGPQREQAVEALYALLLKAARFQVNRHREAISHLRGNDHDELAHQSADDALVAILNNLGDFRGKSRFTTWAYKFAVLEAGTKIRRRAWQGREVPFDSEGELYGALREAIERSLSPHQRDVLVATAFNDVPIDVLAERLNTTRGVLYRTIHDARHKLRAALAARGLGVGEYMETASS